ncbi:hypothetical protein A6A08_18105 [Nocardiopsis sp. TSRI0078]|uniref:hypothetical protein n=1 Tax=unclassified Nocardiopsis TaxID=2649073 RepID=UPI00093A6968|nr:hypothetical protein [Nocardiopsis sp. TSRI0078]OKI22871.1 hypothetical protein A6A08_18105 [Nocardiopsis sp. TSRI0078]
MTTHDAGATVLWRDPERERLVGELAVLAEELADLRLELAAAKSRLEAFTHFHDRIMAPLYAELDEIEACIAALRVRHEDGPEARRDAEAARERARESAWAAQAAEAEPEEDGERPRPQITTETRRLFRDLIRRCHPDLAEDEADRARREEFTQLVNEAYARGDAQRLAELSRGWRSGDAAAVRRSGLDEPRTAVADLADQVERARAELEHLTTTGMGEILFHERDPEAVVHRLAQRVRTRIARQQRVLSEMRRSR